MGASKVLPYYRHIVIAWNHIGLKHEIEADVRYDDRKTVVTDIKAFVYDPAKEGWMPAQLDEEETAEAVEIVLEEFEYQNHNPKPKEY